MKACILKNQKSHFIVQENRLYYYIARLVYITRQRHSYQGYVWATTLQFGKATRAPWIHCARRQFLGILKRLDDEQVKPRLLWASKNFRPLYYFFGSTYVSSDISYFNIQKFVFGFPNKFQFINIIPILFQFLTDFNLLKIILLLSPHVFTNVPSQTVILFMKQTFACNRIM